jgi:hypothetical protein
MSALSVEPPYPAFADADGQPLEDGYIFIGTANLNPITNPIAVFFNPALTIAAVQPIRTSGGYPVYQGTPTRIYTANNYSIQVQNKNGTVVYSSLQNNPINAESVIYDPPFANAVETNVEAKLAQTTSVKDFGAVGDGVTNDTVAIQRALNIAGRKTVYFPTGVYLIDSLEVSLQFTSIQADTATLLLNPTGTFTHALKLTTNFLTITGALIFQGDLRSNYDSTLWIKGGYGRYENVTFRECKLAIRIGEPNVNQFSLSEMFFSKCITNGCRNAIEMYGLFSVANFTDCIFVGNENAAWAGQDGTTIKNYGGRLFMENTYLYGGSSLTQPIIEVNQIEYLGLFYSGSVYLNNIDSESYGRPFLRVTNVSAINAALTSGDVLICNSRLDFFSFGSLSPQPDFFFFNNTYTGTFKTVNNRFKWFDILTQRPIAIGANTKAQINVEDLVANFPYYGTNAIGFSGFPPQIPFQNVLSVTMNSAFLAGSSSVTQPVVFDTIRAGIQGQRIPLSDYYSTATGQFTVPKGGLSSIMIIANYIVSGALGAGAFTFIQHTSLSGGFTRQYGYQPIVAAGGQVIANIVEAAEGDLITLQMNTQNAGAALDVTLNFNNQMTICAYITTPNQ